MIPMRRTWYVTPRGVRWSVMRQDGRIELECDFIRPTC
jgi:hypothetical protein